MSSLPRPGTLLTGSTLSPQVVGYFLLASADLWVVEALYGMVYDLTTPNRFTQGGTVTPAQAAEFFLQVWESLTVSVFQVGAIIPFATFALPTGVLLCDGATYLDSDWPLLAAIIDPALKPDATHFVTPDLRGRTVVGAGTGTGLTPRATGDSFGEEAHQLTTSELASHTHTESATAPTAIAIGLGILAPAAVGVPGVTGATGSSVPHNNMQPSGVLLYGIIAQ